MMKVNERDNGNSMRVIALCAFLTACSTTSQKPLSEELPPGYRGTAIEVSAAELKMVHPRDRIDIITTRPANLADPNGPRVGETILQNVLVFRVGGIKNGRGAVYVALNPNESQWAMLEDLSNHFHITVRPKGDKESYPMEKVEARKLFR